MSGAMMLKGTPQDGREKPARSQHDDEADDIAEIHRGNQAPDEFLLFDEQHRSGLQAPDQEAAEQQPPPSRARHAQRKHRQQRRVPAACAAVSGATTPSISPLPKFAPFCDTRLAMP